MINEIKLIPIQQVIDRLGIKYRKVGDTLNLLDNGKETDGWKATVKHNHVTSFSAGRAQGNPLEFYVQHTGESLQNAMNYFKDEFNISDDRDYKPYMRKQIDKPRDSSPAEEYLASRGIDMSSEFDIGLHTFARLKDETHTVIKMEMKDLVTGEVIGDQKRAIEDKLFETNGNDGFFVSEGISKKYVMITEGMVDYLSCKRFFPSTIGMKSCNRSWSIDEKEYLSSFDKVICLLDNDDAGRKGCKKLKEMLDTNIFTVDLGDYNDINELLMGEGELVNYFRNNKNQIKKKPFEHITQGEKVKRAGAELMATNPREVMKWGWKLWDEQLGGIYGGKIYAIGAESGTGKSTFINQICNNVEEQGFRVTKYSLEDRMEDIGKEDIYYHINRVRRTSVIEPYDFIKFVNNEYGHPDGTDYDPDFEKWYQKGVDSYQSSGVIELDKDKMVTLGDFITLMEKECIKGTKLFAIDHLHYFKMDDSGRTDLAIQNAMHMINELARKYNVAVFLVAHYRKLNGGEPTNDSFKDGTAITQVANQTIHIYRDRDLPGNQTRFIFGKIRGPISRDEIVGDFDLVTYTYSFAKTDNLRSKLDLGEL